MAFKLGMMVDICMAYLVFIISIVIINIVGIIIMHTSIDLVIIICIIIFFHLFLIVVIFIIIIAIIIISSSSSIFFFFFCNRPDMTFAVDWALKTNYLSISPLLRSYDYSLDRSGIRFR